MNVLEMTDPGSRATSGQPKSRKSKTVATLLCQFLGIFGVHRFYEGKIVTGIVYIFALEFLGIDLVADLLQNIFGVRQDKKGLFIGSPLRRGRGLVKAPLIVMGMVVVTGPAFVLGQIAAERLAVPEGYYKEIVTGGPIEEKYGGLGPYEVAFTELPSNRELFKNINIWYPKGPKAEDLSKYPAVLFVNASNLRASKYAPVFEHLSSWGFITIGNDDPASGDGKTASETLDFLLAANADLENPLYQKVDTAHIGVTGGSQGGAGAINAATRYPNSDKIASIFLISTPQPDVVKALAAGKKPRSDWTYDMSKVRVPYFAVAGTGDADAKLITPLASLRSSYEAVPDGIPAGIARRNDGDHEAMLTLSDGYMTAWFRFTLWDDRTAAEAFKGSDPEIARNKNWRDVELKKLDTR